LPVHGSLRSSGTGFGSMGDHGCPCSPVLPPPAGVWCHTDRSRFRFWVAPIPSSEISPGSGRQPEERSVPEQRVAPMSRTCSHPDPGIGGRIRLKGRGLPRFSRPGLSAGTRSLFLSSRSFQAGCPARSNRADSERGGIRWIRASSSRLPRGFIPDILGRSCPMKIPGVRFRTNPVPDGWISGGEVRRLDPASSRHRVAPAPRAGVTVRASDPPGTKGQVSGLPHLPDPSFPGGFGPEPDDLRSEERMPSGLPGKAAEAVITGGSGSFLPKQSERVPHTMFPREHLQGRGKTVRGRSTIGH
jgi:hypothetical protein